MAESTAQNRRQFPQFLTKEDIKYYSRVDNLRFPLAVLTELFTIALVILASELYWHPIVYLLAVIVIGSRIHALAVLMHDSCHYRASNNRLFNDLLGEFISLPLPSAMEGFRKNHLAHHNELNTGEDPDWVRTRSEEFTFPKSKTQIFMVLAQYGLGLKAYKDLKQLRKEKYLNDVPRSIKLARAGIVGSIIIASIYFGFWQELLLYWVIPLLTAFSFFLYIRSVSEHYTNLTYENLLKGARTVVAPFWQRWLFAPYGINYHIEHHMYPSVPYYRLPELHQYLMTKPEYAQNAHITRGYQGLFRESCAA